MKPISFPRVLVCAVAIITCGKAAAQNIVENDATAALERRAVSEAELALLDQPLARAQQLGPLPAGEAAQLAARVDELIGEWPWRPFFHQLGISGSETHFGHPDELFHVLSLAAPLLEPRQADRVKAFLAQRLADAPPYAIDGFDPKVGRARERYALPEPLRAAQPRKARDAWGVYAFYEHVTASGDEAAIAAHWPAIRERLRSLLEQPYTFNPATVHRHDEAQRLNGDLAGLYAAIRLGALAKDDAAARAARARAADLLQLRLDLERLNPQLLEPTDVASKTLHHFKLARYLHLPEPALVLLRHDQTAAARMRPFREARPGWWMAFGDRFIGGENYTTSPDFSRAVFIAATQLEPVAPELSSGWIDVPWCKADLYFIERLALFLRSASGK